jgi:hypothetical protein
MVLPEHHKHNRMNKKTPLDMLRELEQKHQQELAEVRSAAVSELVRRIAQVKEELKELEQEYAALTGKDFKGQPVSVKKRVRFSEEEKEAIKGKVLGILVKATSFSGIKKQLTSAGADFGSDAILRGLLSDLKTAGKIQLKGERAAAVYQLA